MTHGPGAKHGDTPFIPRPPQFLEPSESASQPLVPEVLGEQYWDHYIRLHQLSPGYTAFTVGLEMLNGRVPRDAETTARASLRPFVQEGRGILAAEAEGRSMITRLREVMPVLQQQPPEQLKEDLIPIYVTAALFGETEDITRLIAATRRVSLRTHKDRKLPKAKDIEQYLKQLTHDHATIDSTYAKRFTAAALEIMLLDLCDPEKRERIQEELRALINAPVEPGDTSEPMQEPSDEGEGFIPKIDEEYNWTFLPDSELRQTGEQMTREIQQQYTGKKQLEFDPQRLQILQRVAEYWGPDKVRYARGKLRGHRTTNDGQERPDEFLLLVLQENGKDVAVVAESPLKNAHAAYVWRHDITPGDWREVMALEKSEARASGVRRLVHKAPEGGDVYEHVTGKILQLLAADEEEFREGYFEGKRGLILKTKVGQVAVFATTKAVE